MSVLGAILDRRSAAKTRKRKPRRKPEPIRMTARRHNYFPKQFVWRGHRHTVHAVERAWTVTKRGQRAARHCFRVRCASGTFEIYQDLSLNTWYMARRVG